MPRVFEAKKNKGGKDYHCTKCGVKIEPGTVYLYFTRYRAKDRTIRCVSHRPLPSELTSSETLSEAYSISETYEEAVRSAGCIQDVIDALDEAVTGVESLKDTVEDKINNLENAFPNGCPALETLQEYQQNLEQWYDELDQAKSEADDFLSEAEEQMAEGDEDEDTEERADDGEGEFFDRALEAAQAVSCPL